MSLRLKYWTTVLTFVVSSFIPAAIWHLVLFEEKYKAMGAATRSEPIIVFGIFAMLAQGMVFAYFYPMYLEYKNINSSIKSAIKFSLIFGVNVWTVMVFAMAAKMYIEPVWEYVLLGTCFQFIQFVCVGTSVGMVHKNRFGQ